MSPLVRGGQGRIIQMLFHFASPTLRSTLSKPRASFVSTNIKLKSSIKRARMQGLHCISLCSRNLKFKIRTLLEKYRTLYQIWIVLCQKTIATLTDWMLTSLWLEIPAIATAVMLRKLSLGIEQPVSYSSSKSRGNSAKLWKDRRTPERLTMF